MLKPGDVVGTLLPGAVVTKFRPTIVVSTDLYQSTKRDVIVAEVTTQLGKATTPTDYILIDWAKAGLHHPSAFRLYLGTVLQTDTQYIGHLSDRDWQNVQGRLRLGVEVS